MAATAPPLALLPPPEDRLYATFQDLHEDLKAWGRAQGFAMVIDSSCNRDSSGLYRRYNLSCSKGGKGYTKKGTGLRQGNSHKIGCMMRVKCMQNRAWPWNDRWHIQVIEGSHNHGPFTGGPGEAVPPQFRKLEPDGIRWLLIMHREAKCSLRQLTIGLRVSFGDKYQFVKKSDVSNMLAKVKRGEEKELANRPPGAPPLPPGAMTAFTAAVLNPVVTPQRPGGVPFEIVHPSHQQGQPQPHFQPQLQQHFPNHPPQYAQPQHPPAQHDQSQHPPPQHGQPQHPPPQHGQPQNPPPQHGQPQNPPPQHGQPQQPQPQNSQHPQPQPQRPLPQLSQTSQPPQPQNNQHTQPHPQQAQPQQAQSQQPQPPLPQPRQVPSQQGQPPRPPRWQTPRTAANYAPSQSMYHPTGPPPAQGQAPPPTAAAVQNQPPAPMYHQQDPRAHPQQMQAQAAAPPATPTAPAPPAAAGQPLMTFSPVSEDMDDDDDDNVGENEDEESEEE